VCVCVCVSSVVGCRVVGIVELKDSGSPVLAFV
jgi:hypothetical protein